MATKSRSLLRYPGSKARFADFIASSMRMNGGWGGLFAEPFCGGASVSIALLEDGVADYIALNDADPLISALWDTVFSEDGAAWLSEQVLTIPLTLDEWIRQKELKPTNPKESALKALYLNRTSFNGIIHKSGPVGGWKQDKRTVAARFNRDNLSNRIKELSKLSDRVVEVSNNDWESFCTRLININSHSFLYLDPPYYHKAEQLYGYLFSHEDHKHLRDVIDGISVRWMLSYDDTPEIRALYRDGKFNARVIDSTYSTHPMGGASFVGRELLYTNMLKLPSAKTNQVEHIGLTVRKVRSSVSTGPVRLPLSSSAIILAAA